MYHRTVATPCPSQRGPGYCVGCPAGSPYCCSSDSQCKCRNQRPVRHPPKVDPTCSYDECVGDSNCPSGTPCICRSSPSDSAANACASGGNCVVDSNCGPGGYCSPSPSPQGCEGPGPYYCHTASDTCSNDADCSSFDGGDPGGVALCVYDVQAQHGLCGRKIARSRDSAAGAPGVSLPAVFVLVGEARLAHDLLP